MRLDVSEKAGKCVFCNRIRMRFCNCSSIMGTFDRAGLYSSHCDSVSVTVMVCVHLWKGLLISSVTVREIAMCWPVGEGGRRQSMPNRHVEGKGWNRLGPM